MSGDDLGPSNVIWSLTPLRSLSQRRVARSHPSPPPTSSQGRGMGKDGDRAKGCPTWRQAREGPWGPTRHLRLGAAGSQSGGRRAEEDGATRSRLGVHLSAPRPQGRSPAAGPGLSQMSRLSECFAARHAAEGGRRWPRPRPQDGVEEGRIRRGGREPPRARLCVKTRRPPGVQPGSPAPRNPGEGQEGDQLLAIERNCSLREVFTKEGMGKGLSGNQRTVARTGAWHL